MFPTETQSTDFMRIAVLLVVVGFLIWPLTSPAQESTEGVSSVQLEALKRLQGVDLDANPKLRAAVLKIVDATQGTPQFVELVRQFKIKDKNDELLRVALKFPEDEAGVSAMQMVLESDGAPLIRQLMAGTNESEIVACAKVLGNTRLPVANRFMAPLLENEASADGVRREVIKALCKNEEGARSVLALGRAGRLNEALRLTAATSLSQVSWTEVRTEAADVFPLPKAGGDEALPAISELVRRSGNAGRGRTVFFSETTACNRCHQVAGQGTAIGPDLSQIGDKLGKDALFEAILDPNNGIAFGYEAWTVTTREDEEIYGLIVSETSAELSVKDLSGIVHRLPKSSVTSRVQSKFSLMPVGLQATMRVQELVDLVEFLSGLKKASGGQ